MLIFYLFIFVGFPHSVFGRITNFYLKNNMFPQKKISGDGIEYPVKRRLSRSQIYCRRWLEGHTSITLTRRENCSLCLSEIQVNEDVYLLPCANNEMNHFFHKDCLIEYFIQSDGICINCPICRFVWYDINSDDSD